MTTGVESWEAGGAETVFDRPLPVWLTVLEVAVGLELLLHNSLFYGSPLGLGFTLAAIATAALIAFSGPLTGTEPSTTTKLFAGGMVLFGLFVTFRASPVLTTLNVMTVLALLFGAAFLYSTGRLWDLRLMDYPRAGLITATQALAQTGDFLRIDVRNAGLMPTRGWHRIRPYVRGTAIAIGPVAVFLTLFVSADAVFATLVADVFGVDLRLNVLIWSLVLITGFSWLLIGLLRYGTSSRGMEDLERPSGLRLGTREATTVLALVNGLFLSFVVVQFAYLFGGADVIERTGGLTRAEYAREGFFQLVAVAGFVLAFVLILDWWTRPAGSPAARAAGWLQASLVGLTGIVLISALVRMRLYVAEFGLTQLRFYALALMIWIGGLLVWSLVTVLPGRRALFGSGTFLSLLVLVATLNVVNPDATIARVNVDRYVNGGATIDLDYLVHNLSADAAPVLQSNAAVLPPLDLPDAGSSPVQDWRNYNLSRSRATR
ncbi:MAG: DUF4173 domain-containing protein [Acidimicrobiia bacterium]|nr:DUF4173 domain-containing protein [Acidimicrobiia bacterium]